jgi:hypothetical protein
MTKALGLLLTSVAACFYASAAHAGGQDPAPVSPASENAAAPATDAPVAVEAKPIDAGDDGWHFATTSYLWATSIKSQVTTRQGEQVTSKQSFFDILKDLKFAFMGAAEARHKRFVVIGDLIYSNVGSSANGHLGPVPLDANIDVKMLITNLEAGYRVVDQGPMYLDLLAGAQLTSLKLDLDLKGPLTTVHRNPSASGVAPVLGARFRAPLGGRWGAAFYGDVAGFGITPAHSWQLLGTVQYRLSDHWQIAGGWRHYSVKDDEHRLNLHVALDGPILAITYRM